MNDKYAIPHYLDEPYKILLWTIDEVVVFILPTFLGLTIFNYPLTGVVLGIVMIYALKKLKSDQGHYFIYDLCYWYCPPLIPYRVIPPSYIREWVG